MRSPACSRHFHRTWEPYFSQSLYILDVLRKIVLQSAQILTIAKLIKHCFLRLSCGSTTWTIIHRYTGDRGCANFEM